MSAMTPIWSLCRAFVRNLVRRDAVERDLDQELESCYELAVEEKVAAGLAEPAARRAARLELGGREQIKEQVRDARVGAWVEGLVADVVYGVRTLRRDASLAVVIVGSLALGFGATGATLSLADALILRPLPVPDPGAVVTVGAEGPGESPLLSGRLSFPNYRDLRAASRSVEGLVAYRQAPFSFARSAEAVPEMRLGTVVSDNFFRALDVEPRVGRGFAADEGRVPGRDPVVVLAHDFWQRGFGGDRTVVNTVVRINGIDFTVIGVAPPRFTGPERLVRPAFYLPLSMDRALEGPGADRLEDRGRHRFVVVKGRLAGGVTRAEARAELTTLWEALARQYPDANRNRAVTVHGELESRLRRSAPDAVLVGLLVALALVVLLIACANVSNLLLGRATTRGREMALRLALGAGRLRLVRQLLTESLLLAACGAAVGVGVAYGGVRLFRAIRIPTDFPIVIDPQLDARVVGLSLLLGVGGVLLFGLAPAWQGVRTPLMSTLRQAAPGRATVGRGRGRRLLVAAQVALSTVLLVVTGVLLDGFRQVVALDPGFRTDRVMTLSIDTSLTGYTDTRTHDFYRDLVDRAETLTGVRRVALASSIPLNPDGFTDRLIVPDRYELPAGQDHVSVLSAVVDEHYFDTVGTALVRGRAFTADDTPDARPVAVVNDALASRYWPGRDPIGQRLSLADGTLSDIEVVGVARTGKYFFITEPPTPFLYLPFAQHERPAMTLLVEAADGDPAALAAPLGRLVHDLDAALPVFNLRTLAEVYEQRAVAMPRLILQVVATMGGLGLALALVGLYSVVAYSVARRVREIGIRMAIGATRGDVLALVLRQGATLATVGVAVGGVASVGLGRSVGAVVTAGLVPAPAVLYLLVPAGLVALSLVASWAPARRAARVEPVRTLRAE